MLDVTVIRCLLVNSAPLTAIVSAEKIVFDELAKGTPMPAILIEHISSVWGKEVSGQSKFCRARVQITVMASSYSQKKQIMALLLAAIPRKPGAIAGVNVESILREPDGPDFRDSAAGILMQTQDFMVSFNE